MAYGSMNTGQLHVAQVYNTVTDVTAVLTAIDYAYNLAAIVDLYDQGYSPSLDTVLNLLRRAEPAGISTTNFALQAFVPTDAQMQLEALEFSNSFIVKFGGLGRVIEALTSVFDPLARKERHEDLRHKRQMNLLAEDEAELTLADRRLEIAMRVLTDERSNFNQRAREDLGENRASELRLLLAREFGYAVDSLSHNKIDAIETSS